jgi:hypothetical protein
MCLLLILALISFFIFPPLGVLLLLVAIVAALFRGNQGQAAIVEQLKIANMTPEQRVVYTAQQKKNAQSKNRAVAIIGGALVLFFVIGGIASNVGKQTVSMAAHPQATPYAESTPTTTPYEQPTPQPQATPYGDTAEATPEPTIKRALPVATAQVDKAADANLNRAWAALTQKQRNQFRQSQRDWIRQNNALSSVEARNESTRARAKYIWSLAKYPESVITP